jgi:hypothetical protein
MWTNVITFYVCMPGGLMRDCVLQNDGRGAWRIIAPWHRPLHAIQGQDMVAEGKAACQAIVGIVTPMILS